MNDKLINKKTKSKEFEQAEKNEHDVLKEMGKPDSTIMDSINTVEGDYKIFVSQKNDVNEEG